MLFLKRRGGGLGDEKVIIGTVIKAFLANTNPPKEKRFIIVGESYDHLFLACVFINSEINENVFRTETLKKNEYSISG